MNTRVQVEHCVTEMTTGIDIVKEGIRAAAGEPLAYAQEDVCCAATRSSAASTPRTPPRTSPRRPAGSGATASPPAPACAWTRAWSEGGEVSPMYDPMVAKLIVWDADREQATQRMLRALGEYEIEGLKTLIPFHQALLATEQWAKGETCRDLLEDKQWLKTLAFGAPEPAAGDEGEAEAEEKVEQTYEVEVSGKRFDVTRARPAGRGRRRRARMNGAASAGGRRPPKRGAERRSASKSAAGGGPTRCPRPCRATCGRCWSSRATPSPRASCCASSRR